MNTFFRRNLPHYYVPNAVYFITFRLAGSLPAEAITRAEEIYEAHLRRLDQTLSGAERVAARYRAQKQHFARVDTLLDQAKYGPRWLANPECARIVAGCIHELDSTFYHLHAYCIMPNHVHLLIDVHNIPEPPPRADGRTFTALSQAMPRLKGKSAVLCNRLLGRRGPFWQHESYDHVVRNAQEYERILVYILNNPVKANLVDNWKQWPYTYVNGEQA